MDGRMIYLIIFFMVLCLYLHIKGWNYNSASRIISIFWIQIGVELCWIFIIVLKAMFRKLHIFCCLFCFMIFLFGLDSVWRVPAFQETPLCTIVGQCASGTRYGSPVYLPPYSHNTDTVDLSKTGAWEGIQCQEAAGGGAGALPIREIIMI